jgi:hypothetical protein
MKRTTLSLAVGTGFYLTVWAPCNSAADTAYLEDHEETGSFAITHEPTPASHTAGKPLALDLGGVSLQFGGFAQGDWIYDADYVGNDSQFKVNSIAVPPDPNADLGGNSNLQAKATRFTVDLRSTEGLSSGLRAYVEGDFFGSGGSFRLRHGYGEYRGLLAGQTWTTFQDISARPLTLDYEGPDGEIFVRQAMVRYTGKPSDGLQWSVAIEDSESQVDLLGKEPGSGRSELPDLTGNVRLVGNNAHLQLSGLLRQISYETAADGADDTIVGWGLSLSGRKEFGSTSLMGQLAYGSGMGRYVESFGGTNSDAVLRPDGNLEALDAVAAVAGVQQKWTSRLSSTLAGSFAEIDNDTDQATIAIQRTLALHTNLIYTLGQFQAGVELMWGERENSDGSTGDATRVQTTIRYRFR